ncbi:methyltransferase family protein [Bacteroidota bacterium]
MDPLNILFGIALIISMGANFSATKSSLKQQVTKFVTKPKSYLQKVPLNVSAFLVILELLGVFGVGVFKTADTESWMIVRMVFLLMYIIFSWLQIYSFKSLGKNYSPEIVILYGHELVEKGPYKIIRHPQYLFQFLSDLSAGITLLSYPVLLLVIIFEIPLFILRARKEEKMLKKHFGNTFTEYKKKSSFIIPLLS